MTPEELKERHCETLERNIELAQDILKANAEVRRLQQENIELAAMVGRMQAALWQISNAEPIPDLKVAFDRVVYDAQIAFDQSPPTGYAAKVLALAGAVLGYAACVEVWGSSVQEHRIKQAAAAFTEDEIKLLNGGM